MQHIHLLPIFLVKLTIISRLLMTNAQNTNVFRFEPIVIIEEPPIGTLIIDLANKLDIQDLATSDYKFRFYSPQSLTSHYFLIDQLTGHVKTQRTLDREFLCETKVCGPCTSTSNCSLPIEIVATQTQANSKQKLNKHQMTVQKFVSFDVIIEDKNEFAPKFPKDVIYINVSEAAPPNFSIPIEPAQDRDSRQTQIKYSLEPVLDDRDSDYEDELEKLNSKIRLLLDESSTSQSQLNLIIIEPFDYEIQKEVKFKILASDGPLNKGQKVLTGSCLVVLKVIDINDNLPVFDSNQYEYRLDEDKALADTRLIRVHATDKDDGLNGLVKYSLVDQASTNQQQQQPSIENDVQIKSLFQIDELTGWISVSPNVNLDFEQMSTYRLKVRAQDSGLANSMPVYTTCIIYLNDINDNQPQINLTLPSSIDDFNTNLSLTSNNQIELSEWTMPNTFIAQILVTDLDSGLNGKVKLETREARRKTKSFFNQEFENDYLAEEESDYSDDSDWEESNDFSLIHLFNNIYSLMLKQGLDREQFDRYVVNITASDHGQPIQLKTSLKLSIKILDENDNKPVFLSLLNQTNFDKLNNRVIGFEFNISEVANSENYKNEWVEIGRVKAIDNDLDKNSFVTYELDSDSTMFRIDPVLGLIQANKQALDRELNELYVFNLSAKDNLNKETVKLRINLFDLNDNAPKFEKDIYKFQIYENYFSNEKSFARLKANDLDKIGTNFSLIRFDLLDKNDFFEIDRKTGDLIQLREFDYEKIQFFELEALAYDNLNKTPSLNSTCLIQFEIIDLNDNAPVLISPKDVDLPLVYSIENLINKSSIISEASSVTVKLAKLNASDPDSGQNSKLIFKIEKQVKLRQEKIDQQEEFYDIFSIDSKTGLISAKINLKHKPSTSTKSKPKRHISSYRLNNQISEYDYDEKAIGIYGLVVNISDSSESNPLSIRAYVFIAFTSDSNTNKSSIILLKSILNETKLNSNLDDEYDYEYDDISDKIEQDLKFNRVVIQYQKSHIKLSKKKQYLQNKAQMSHKIFKAKQNDNFVDEILGSYFKIKTTKDYNYLLVFILSICFLLTIIIASLCLFSVYYKRVKKNRNQPAKKHLCDIYSDNLDSSKKTTLNTTNSSKLASSSASPSSSTSSELLNTHSNRNSTDDDEDDSGGFRNLSNKSVCNQSKNSNSTTTFLTKADLIREEERAILIVNTSSVTSSHNLGSTSSSTNSTKSTNTSNKTNPLLVLVSSSSSSTSSPSDKKLIVASSESLSSIKTTSRASEISTTSQKLQSISNSFKTFNKNSSNQQDQELEMCSPKHTILLTNDYSNSYRTMPLNGYRNLISVTNCKSNNKNLPDQATKILNLPVNELFKRYELKKQATNGVIASSLASSSGSLTSLNSLKLNKKIIQTKAFNNSSFNSPKLAQRNFNLNPIINITSNNQNEIPDYFFKDEKEHKMFLTASSNSSVINANNSSKNFKNRQILNLKQVVVDSTKSTT